MGEGSTHQLGQEKSLLLTFRPCVHSLPLVSGHPFGQASCLYLPALGLAPTQ